MLIRSFLDRESGKHPVNILLDLDAKLNVRNSRFHKDLAY